MWAHSFSMIMITTTLFLLGAPSRLPDQNLDSRVISSAARNVLNRLAVHINDPTAWSTAVNSAKLGLCSASLACAGNHTECAVSVRTASGETNNQINCLYSLDGSAMYFDGRFDSHGLDISGQPCESFGRSDECIFRPKISWKPSCSGASCTSNSYTVEVALVIDSRLGNLVNLSQARYEIIK